MLFHLSEYLLDSPIYAVYLYREITEKEYLQICGIIRYYCRKDNVNWLAVFSTTTSETAEIKQIKTGKRGRPKKQIYGTKVSGHTHISVKGEMKKSAYKTAQVIKRAFNKKYHRPISRVVSKGNQFDARVWIGYCLKQADIIRSGGDFDFQNEAIIL